MKMLDLPPMRTHTYMDIPNLLYTQTNTSITKELILSHSLKVLYLNPA